MLTCDQLQNLDIHIGDISISRNGAKNAPVGLGADLKTLRLVLSKTPVLTTPFEPKAFDGGDRVSFDLQAGPLESKIDLLDSAILACVVQNKDKFWKKPPPDSELKNLYVPLKKEPNDPKYSALVRLKMTFGDNPSARFWTPSKQPLDYRTINWRDSEFAVQVRLKSIWFQSNKSFGGCLEVEHVMVRQRDMSCPFDDDASEDMGC